MAKSKLAVWSFVLIIALLILPYLVFQVFGFGEVYQIYTFQIYFAPIICLTSLALGIIALIKIQKRKNLTGKWFAIMGIILSILYLIFLIFLLQGPIA